LEESRKQKEALIFMLEEHLYSILETLDF